MARVVAISASIAGLFLLLYFVDHFFIGWFDPSYLLVWNFQAASVKAPGGYPPPVTACAMWSMGWILTSINAFRHPGRPRVAVFSGGMLLAGAVLVFAINQVTRNFH